MAEPKTGRGIAWPLQLDSKGDLVTNEGTANLKLQVELVFCTRADIGPITGELRWNPGFGSKYAALRHRNNELAIQGEATEFSLDAIDQWLPLIVLTGVVARREVPEGRLIVKTSYAPNGADGRGLLDEGSVEVSI